MYAVVGLGNPGTRYEETRHNVGFKTAAVLAKRWAPGESWQQKGGCLFLKTRIGSSASLIVLPQEYMNLSGKAAAPLLRFFKVPVEDVVVVYDELDLDPGQLRIKQGGSSGSHNGIADLVRHFGSGNFFRIRLGIGHPRRVLDEGKAQALNQQENKQLQGVVSGVPYDVSAWVLGQPRPKEKELLEKAVLDAADAVELLFDRGLKEVQQQFHRKQSGE